MHLRATSRPIAAAAIIVCAALLSPSYGVAMSPRAQEPKPAPKAGGETKPPVDTLDAEREKLRMKDVEAWKKQQVKSLEQVMDVKKATQPLEYPATITDADKTKMAEIFKRAKEGGGGARTNRALRELEKMGFPALIFLVNELREIDYKDPVDATFGMQLNMSLQTITLGVNTGYVAIDIGEPMDPRKAQWNAMTVQQWQGGVKTQWPTQEKFDEYITKRRLKKEKELEEGGEEAKKGDDKKKGE